MANAHEVINLVSSDDEPDDEMMVSAVETSAKRDVESKSDVQTLPTPLHKRPSLTSSRITPQLSTSSSIAQSIPTLSTTASSNGPARTMTSTLPAMNDDDDDRVVRRVDPRSSVFGDDSDEEDIDIDIDELDSMIKEGSAPDVKGIKKSWTLKENLMKGAKIDTPRDLRFDLMMHQKQGLYWMSHREDKGADPRGGMLCDEQGLGKTLQTIALMHHNQPPPNPDGSRARFRTLVVCPVTLIDQWMTEIRKFSKLDLKIYKYHGPDRSREPIFLATHDVVMCSYSGVTNDAPVRGPDDVLLREAGPLFKVKWFRVVLDEAGVVKNRRSQSSKAVAGLKAERRWCLTGTPVQNKLSDLYSLFRFMHYSSFRQYADFKRELIPRKGEDQDLSKIRSVLAAVCLRRTKDGKLYDGTPLMSLPEKYIEVKHLNFSPDERDFYNAIEERVQLDFNKYLQQNQVMNNYINVLAMLQKMRMACDHPYLCISDMGQIGRSRALQDVDDQLRRLYRGVSADDDDDDDDDLLALDFALTPKQREEKEKRQAARLAAQQAAKTISQRLKDLTKDDIQARLSRYRKDAYQRLMTETDMEMSCPICLDDVHRTDTAVMHCGHCLCNDCFDNILQRTDKNCPLCRIQIQIQWAVSGSSIWQPKEPAPTVKAATAATTENKSSDAQQSEEDVVMIVSDNESDAQPRTRSVRRTRATTRSQAAKTAAVNGQAAGKTLGTRGRRELNQRRAAREANERVQYRNRLAAEAQSQEERRLLLQRALLHSEELFTDNSDSTKLKAFVEQVAELMSTTDDKVLVFCQWLSMLDLMQGVLGRMRVPSLRLDGSMKLEERVEVINEFTNQDEPRVLLCSLQAVAYGLNLNIANHVILIDPWWNPAVENQAIDRVHRIGQTKPVFVTRYIVQGTVEDRILQLQKSKQQLADGCFEDNGNLNQEGLSLNDLVKLFNVRGRRRAAPLHQPAQPLPAHLLQQQQQYLQGQQQRDQLAMNMYANQQAAAQAVNATMAPIQNYIYQLLNAFQNGE